MSQSKEKKKKTQEEKGAISKVEAKRLEFLGLMEKRHRSDLLKYRSQQDLERQFGPWAPPPRSPDELEELFFRMFGDLR
jgi:hypothetical protein